MFKILHLCLLAMLFAVVAACSKNTNYAPVVNAWEQPSNKQGGYKVQSGDTIYSIAWAYGIDYRELAKINKLSSPYTISKGEVLNIVPAKTQKNNKKAAVKSSVYVSKPHKDGVTSGWMWPTAGAVVSQFSLKQPINKGIDISGKYGQPIYAANSGKVVYSGNGIHGYGNLIIIKNSTEYLSAYAHNKSNLVKEGQWVKKGQKIATMGYGNSTKPELHFEIRYAGKPVNPLRELPKHK